MLQTEGVELKRCGLLSGKESNESLSGCIVGTVGYRVISGVTNTSSTILLL